MRATVGHIRIFLFILLLLGGGRAGAQYKVQGTVYDSSRSYPVQSVTVMSSNGSGTVTDANGRYTISVGEKDSIWFSYLNKPTMKFPVLKISDVTQFDIAIEVSVPSLPEVKIRQRDYRLDSIRNREEYAKVFNYRKVNIASLTNIGPSGAGIDINEMIRLFQFRKNRNMLKFQDRLLQQEQDKFIDHRFSRGLVIRLTGLEGEALEQFMVRYRPTYEFVLYTSDYDFQSYIKESAELFRKGKGF
ncbi:MAG TPA: hypothetical protein VHK69_07380 [Chitinophagaceae bacterium]|nr:hypothetical protein [Chitinophagaceae bacterium]